MLERLPLGPLQANCYLYGDEGEAVVIDAGAEANLVLELARELGVTIRTLICTHGHYDHTGGLAALARETGADILIHEADISLALSGGLEPEGDSLDELPAWLAEPSALPATPKEISDGDTITVARHALSVIHTPGHTPGSICLYDSAEGVLFSGDTLFRLGVGRVDPPGGHGRTLLNSIKERLFVLPDATRVYPGHGPSTLIGLEKHRNPFVRPSAP